jgi:hypothetical protein
MSERQRGANGQFSDLGLNDVQQLLNTTVALLSGAQVQQLKRSLYVS